MLRFFSETRTITGLFFLVCPMLSVLLTDRPVSFWVPFFCATALSLPILRIALQNLPLRFVLFLFTSVFLLGVSASQAAVSALLLGCSSTLLLLLPPAVMTGWHPRNWTGMLAAAWSAAILGAPLLQYVASLLPQLIWYIFLFCSAGSLICIRKPAESWKQTPPPLILERKKLYLRPAFFTAAISCSLLISLSIIPSPNAAEPPFTPNSLFWLSLACGPQLAARFAEKKGVFSSCILLIFLCEATMLFLGFFTGSQAALAGAVFLALSSGAMVITLPLLTFYLFGRNHYLKNLSRILFSVPLGLFFGVPCLQLAAEGQLPPDEAAIILLFLLVMGFFCIFFAWKQRFVVLKNEII